MAERTEIRIATIASFAGVIAEIAEENMMLKKTFGGRS